MVPPHLAVRSPEMSADMRRPAGAWGHSCHHRFPRSKRLGSAAAHRGTRGPSESTPCVVECAGGRDEDGDEQDSRRADQDQQPRRRETERAQPHMPASRPRGREANPQSKRAGQALPDDSVCECEGRQVALPSSPSLLPLIGVHGGPDALEYDPGPHKLHAATLEAPDIPEKQTIRSCDQRRPRTATASAGCCGSVLLSSRLKQTAITTKVVKRH